MKKAIYTVAIAIFMVLTLNVSTSEAACNVRGYLNSNGACGVSYVNSYVGTTPYQNYTYTTQYSGNAQQQYLLNYIAQLQQILAQLELLRDNNVNNGFNPVRPSGNAAVDVETEDASDIDDDRARLNGEVDFNREDEATVYFLWGERRNDLDNQTTRVVLDEDDDDEDFSQIITRLDEDETYYFRAVAEDERGRRDLGSIESFITDDDRRGRDDDEPYVKTEEAEDVDEDSAELYGEVDMNDFRNGIAFFVYGEDEDQVEDVERDFDEYDDIDEDGDDLQKVFVEDDVDGDLEAWANIFGLDDDTDHYFAFCVEFEDEDDRNHHLW